MSLFSNVVGLMSSFLKIGGPAGPRIRRVLAALEVRDTADAAFANMRGADPIIDDDFVTLRTLNAASTDFGSFNQSFGNSSVPLGAAPIGAVGTPGYANTAAVITPDADLPTNPSVLWAGPQNGNGVRLVIQFTTPGLLLGDDIEVFIRLNGLSYLPISILGPLAGGTYTLFSTTDPVPLTDADVFALILDKVGGPNPDVFTNFRAGLRIENAP